MLARADAVLALRRGVVEAHERARDLLQPEFAAEFVHRVGCAFVRLEPGELVLDVVPDDALKNELMALVRHEIGAIAKPEVIQWAPQLPKTRSGKIMRRVLRKIAAREVDQLGDLSTLADASVIADILEARSLL